MKLSGCILGISMLALFLFSCKNETIDSTKKQIVDNSIFIFEGKEIKKLVWYNETYDLIYTTSIIHVDEVIKGKELGISNKDTVKLSKPDLAATIPSWKDPKYKYVIVNDNPSAVIYFCNNLDTTEITFDYMPEIANGFLEIDNLQFVKDINDSSIVAKWGNQAFYNEKDVYRYVRKLL